MSRTTRPKSWQHLKLMTSLENKLQGLILV